MRTRRILIAATAYGLGMISAACGTKLSTRIADPNALERFGALPVTMAAQGQQPTDAMVSLGRMLYFDARLSRSQTVSCNSCHPLSRYGADGQPTSEGYKGQHGNRNSPTVYNAAAQFAQFWDGRAQNVEEQAKGPLLNPVEMAMPSGKAVVQVLKSMPGYVDAFQRAFPKSKDAVTFDHAAEAIGAFERMLVTPSRWDRFLGGDEAALTDQEKAGFNLFVDTGCSNCHAGPLVGGNSYQRLGAAKPYPDASDTGRYRVTKGDNDWLYFKVAQLRNVAMTGPYFHNGSVATLQAAVSEMAQYQLGKKLSGEQVESIVAWLKSLTGELPVDYIKEPQLPNSTSRTPKPLTEG